MNIKRIWIIVFIFFIVFGLYGCEMKQDTKQKQMGVGTNFIGGSESVVASFMEGEPPTFIFDSGETTFNIAVQLKNEGEADIPKNSLMVKIVGINYGAFKISDKVGNEEDFTKSLNKELRGKSLDAAGNVIPGDIEYVRFENIKYSEKLSANLPLTLKALVCYPYQTTAIVKGICLRKNPLKLSAEGCSINGARTVDVSSGPVLIRNFQEVAAGSQKLQFTFDIVHQGTGELLNESADCWSYNRDDKNIVHVELSGITGIDKLTCSGFKKVDGKLVRDVKLYGGKYTVRCIYTTNELDEQGFEDNLQIVVKYKYRTSATTTLLIKHMIS